MGNDRSKMLANIIIAAAVTLITAKILPIWGLNHRNIEVMRQYNPNVNNGRPANKLSLTVASAHFKSTFRPI
ncbi:MAG: hypothetical protein A2431_01155 [Candidatus Zambryskibacteria bacterium RIFOXYC1_FULL_39_10]|uniref:Uncharacterized protein n=1 Tax=Candidatus Zambryskibacteria bacterium RIFOXYC1_FULL_39_10 TaxID=1802779 RepID=A0A1G2V2L5_9BACT|nr:MAG: hypothetical protein A2431_01155 [Candidatus Zambryskibacteria bacterium RIFOXYC1_FULL_39_10]